jgi:hypothetical protein
MDCHAADNDMIVYAASQTNRSLHGKLCAIWQEGKQKAFLHQERISGDTISLCNLFEATPACLMELSKCDGCTSSSSQDSHSMALLFVNVPVTVQI